MNLQQHEDNIFTKEHTDIEKYLLRIIQRYFDIENIYNQESIEAIIVESIARYKQDIIRDNGGFLFSLNQRTGNIVLTINDLKGERAFDKQSAFNKDFGIDADTICEGNDIRLSDSREPLSHKHEISNIKDLEKKIKEVLPSEKPHVHKNKNILDIINYTGTLTKIDLIIVEYLEKSLNDYYNNFVHYRKEENIIISKAIESLDNYIIIINNELDYAKSLINNAITWIDNAYKYTDNKVSIFKTKFGQVLLKYVSKNDLKSFKKYFDNVYCMISDGEINIPDGSFNFTSVIDNATNPNKILGHSMISEDINKEITLSNINNVKIKGYFVYDLNGDTIKVPLPFIFKSDNITIFVQLKYNNTMRKYFIEAHTINNIQSYITNDNFYNDDTIIVLSTEKIYAGMSQNYNDIMTACLIDSQSKNDFVSLLISGSSDTYYIQGIKYIGESNFKDINGNTLSYFNWDAGEPSSSINEMYDTIYINENKKWAISDEYEQRYAVLEYHLKRLSNYFNNPRIYYQAFKMQQGVI